MMPNAAARLSREAPARSDFAVLLNANAKLVNRRVRRALEGVVPERDLFLSRSADEAISIADTVVARRYETVFTGGGDGTFVSWVNHIVGRAERRALPVPRFGVLALGTGNAVAEVVGARPDAHVEDLAAFQAMFLQAPSTDDLAWMRDLGGVKDAVGAVVPSPGVPDHHADAESACGQIVFEEFENVGALRGGGLALPARGTEMVQERSDVAVGIGP